MSAIDDIILDAVKTIHKDPASAIKILRIFSYETIFNSLADNLNDVKNVDTGYFMEQVFCLAAAFRMIDEIKYHKGFLSLDTHSVIEDSHNILDILKRGNDAGKDLIARIDTTEFVFCSVKLRKAETMNSETTGYNRLIAEAEKNKHRVPNVSYMIVVKNRNQLSKKKHEFVGNVSFVFMDEDGSRLWDGVRKVFEENDYNVKTLYEMYMRSEARIDLELNVVQKAIVMQVLDSITNAMNKGKKHPIICVHASPRIGKTAIFLEVFLRLPPSFRNMISVPYVLSVNTSIVNECLKWVRYEDLDVINVKEKDGDWEDRFLKAQAQEVKTVTTTSIHPDTFDEKYDVIIHEMVGDAVIFGDEADRGLHTLKSEEKASALYSATEKGQTIVEIITSGTGMDRAIHRKTDIDGFISYDYLDLLNAKRQNHYIFDKDFMESLDDVKDKHFKEFLREVQEKPDWWAGTLRNVPELTYATWEFPKEFVDIYLDNNFIDYMPSWGKLLEDPQKNSDFLKQIFLGIFGKSKHAVANNINVKQAGIKDNISFVNQFFMGCTTKTQLYAVENLIREVLGNTHEIVRLSGEVRDDDNKALTNRETNESAENTVKMAIAQAKNMNKEGVIVLSIGMGARSFSVVDLTVHLMFDGGSSDSVEQKGLRACTPGVLENGEKKTQGCIISYAFDENMKPSMQFLFDYAKNHAENSEISINESVNELLSTVNILSINEHGSSIDLTVDDFFEAVGINGSGYERLLSTYRIEEHLSIILSNEKLLAIVNNIDLKSTEWSTAKKQLKMPSGKKQKGKKGKKTQQYPQQSSETTMLISKLCAILLRFYGSLGNLYSMSGFINDPSQLPTIDDIISAIGSDDSLHEELLDQLGLEIEIVQELLTNNCFNSILANDYIRRIQNQLLLDYDNIRK